MSWQLPLFRTDTTRYLDDRLCVLQLVRTVDDDGPWWDVLARRNVEGYPVDATRRFLCRARAEETIREMEPATPLVSLDGHAPTHPLPYEDWVRMMREWGVATALDEWGGGSGRSPTDEHRYVNRTLGFAVTKPEGWVYVERERFHEEMARQVLRPGAEALIEAAREAGLGPAVAMTVAESDSTGLQPTFLAQRSRDMLPDRPIEEHLLAHLVFLAETVTFDLQLRVPPLPYEFGGREAAWAGVTYTHIPTTGAPILCGLEIRVVRTPKGLVEFTAIRAIRDHSHFAKESFRAVRRSLRPVTRGSRI